jgi:hypothetical protein
MKFAKPILKHVQSNNGNEEDIGLAQALCRSIFGTELFSTVMEQLIFKELELHAQWYRARLGTAFFYVATGIEHQEKFRSTVGLLTVRVISARKLLNAKDDPYVELKVGLWRACSYMNSNSLLMHKKKKKTYSPTTMQPIDNSCCGNISDVSLLVHTRYISCCLTPQDE